MCHGEIDLLIYIYIYLVQYIRQSLPAGLYFLLDTDFMGADRQA